MIDRRMFIAAGAAASAIVALPGGAAGLASAATNPSDADARRSNRQPGDPQPRIVLFDERFASGRRFGEAARCLGLSVQPIRAHVTEVWYSQLYPLWKHTPAPVAGLTAYAAMFCLERLAWDHGLRMVHREGRDEHLHFWLIAPPARTAVRDGSRR